MTCLLICSLLMTWLTAICTWFDECCKSFPNISGFSRLSGDLNSWFTHLNSWFLDLNSCNFSILTRLLNIFRRKLFRIESLFHIFQKIASSWLIQDRWTYSILTWYTRCSIKLDLKSVDLLLNPKYLCWYS
jgi:hypothetical protein